MSIKFMVYELASMLQFFCCGWENKELFVVFLTYVSISLSSTHMQESYSSRLSFLSAGPPHLSFCLVKADVAYYEQKLMWFGQTM